MIFLYCSDPSRHLGHEEYCHPGAISPAKPTANQKADRANATGIQTDIFHKTAYNRSTIETADFWFTTIIPYVQKPFFLWRPGNRIHRHLRDNSSARPACATDYMRFLLD